MYKITKQKLHTVARRVQPRALTICHMVHKVRASALNYGSVMCVTVRPEHMFDSTKVFLHFYG